MLYSVARARPGDQFTDPAVAAVVPKGIIANADGEPNPEIEAEVLAEIGETGPPMA